MSLKHLSYFIENIMASVLELGPLKNIFHATLSKLSKYETVNYLISIYLSVCPSIESMSFLTAMLYLSFKANQVCLGLFSGGK